MEIFRVTRNAFGQEILVGVSWDLLWPFLGASVAFIILHMVFKFIAGRRKKSAAGN